MFGRKKYGKEENKQQRGKPKDEVDVLSENAILASIEYAV